MRITILCSDLDHPVFPWLRKWIDRRSVEHKIDLISRKADAAGGDLLFLISCHEIIDASVRVRYRKTLVIHAADLPEGRGWSPHIWTLVEGKNWITITLLEASDKVDTGPIWHKLKIELAGHELHDEINSRLFDAELALMDFAVDNFHTVVPTLQPETGAGSPYPRRTPNDSRLDPDKTLRELFPLLRVADPNRYPAFFELFGHRYDVILRKSRDCPAQKSDD